MILSDKDIRKALEADYLKIDGLEPEDYDLCIQPSSVDLRLSNSFSKYRVDKIPLIDTRNPPEDMMEDFELPDDTPLIIQPGDFILGSSVEWIKMPTNLMGHLQGRSSLARIGLMANCLAGLIDPGSYGNITFQLSNLARIPIAIYPGQRICQISFSTLTSEVETPYGEGHGSKYHGSIGPVGSKIGADPDNKPHSVILKNIQLPEPYPSGALYKGQGPNGLTPADKVSGDGYKMG